jgi:hypothetical protein
MGCKRSHKNAPSPKPRPLPRACHARPSLGERPQRKGATEFVLNYWGGA